MTSEIYVEHDPYEGYTASNSTPRKGQFHQHSEYADVDDRPHRVIDECHAADFDVLSLTTKSSEPPNRYPWQELGSMRADWESRDPEALGMIQVQGAELERVPHVIQLFSPTMRADYDDGGSLYQRIKSLAEQPATEEGVPTAVQLPHVGRRFESDEWEEFVITLRNYPELVVGIEPLGYGGGYDDRDTWDRLQTYFGRRGQLVTGFSTDDSVAPDKFHTGWVEFPMSDAEFDPGDQTGTRQDLRQAMAEGRCWMVARPRSPDPYPQISEVVHDEGAGELVVGVDDYDGARWIADGEVIARGTELRYREHATEIESYVRFEAGYGDLDDTQNGGTACTQPILMGPHEVARVTS